MTGCAPIRPHPHNGTLHRALTCAYRGGMPAPVISAKGSWSTATRAATAKVSTATATVTQTVVSAPRLLPQDEAPVSEQPAG